MRGVPPLLDYGIEVSVLPRHDESKSKTLRQNTVASLVKHFQWSEFHVIKSHSTDACIQLDTESPRGASRDFPPKARGLWWVQVSTKHLLWAPRGGCASLYPHTQICFSPGAIVTISATIHWAPQTLEKSWRMSFPTWKHVGWAWEENPNILWFSWSWQLL